MSQESGTKEVFNIHLSNIYAGIIYSDGTYNLSAYNSDTATAATGIPNVNLTYYKS